MIFLLGIGLFYLFGYWAMTRFPSKQINYIHGYRTKRAMKSQKHWNFAQRYAAKQFRNWGVILLVISVLCFLADVSAAHGLILALGMLAFSGLMIYLYTEHALRKK